MILLFYYIMSCIISWLFIFIAIRISENIFIKRSFSGEISFSTEIRSEMKTGHLVWIIIPACNIIAGLVYLCRVWYYSKSKFSLVDLFFGKDE